MTEDAAPLDTAPAGEVGSRVRRHVHEAFAAARRLGAGELADVLLSTAQRAGTTRPVVVAVGEPKRGKSSLINALLEWPDLSPVDVDITTSTFLEFGYNPTPQARVFLADEETMEIDVSEIPRWATVAGNPGNRAGVQWVQVLVPSPILRQLTFIDTPGVGGLVSEHGELALEAVERASALLFVLDAGAPLLEPELHFLERAAQRIEQVIFAVTKIDQYAGWERIVDNDRALLAAHAPRFQACPFVPVSSTLALEALAETGSAEAREELRVESNIAELERILHEKVAGRHEALVWANQLRLARYVLEDLTQRAEQRLEITHPDDGLRRALERQREDLAELSDEESWAPNLRHEISKAKLEIMGSLERELADLAHRYEMQVASVPSGRLGEVEQEVDSSFAVLAERAVRAVDQRLVSIAGALLGGQAGSRRIPPQLSSPAAPVVPLLPRPAEPNEPRPSAAAGVLGGISGAESLGGAVGWLELFNIPLPALPAVASLVAGGLVLRWAGKVVARQRRKREDLREWVRYALHEAGGELREELERRLTEAEFALSQAMRADIGRRQEEVRTDLEQCEAALAASEAARRQIRQTAEQQVADIKLLVTKNQRLLLQVA
jgi:hypothetical protein